jgi:hypothetical protein
VGKLEEWEVEQCEKLSKVLLHLTGILNFDSNLGRVAFGKMFMLK